MNATSRFSVFSGRALATTLSLTVMLGWHVMAQEVAEFPGLGPPGALQQIRFESGAQQELVLQGPIPAGNLLSVASLTAARCLILPTR